MADRVVINKMYDVIVIGASKEGLATAKYLFDAVGKLNLCLISPTVKDERFFNELKTNTTTDFFEQKAIYSVFNHGLHYITLQDGRNVCGRNIVIATGTKPKDSQQDKRLNIRYTVDFTDKDEAKKSALVIGYDELAAKNTLTLAKRYKQVFLCNEMFNLLCSAKTKEAIDKTDNITYLPSTGITAVEPATKQGYMLASTDTFSTIPCDVIIKTAEEVPDVSGLADNMVTLNEDGTAVTDDSCRTEKIATIYAIGKCAGKTNKKDIKALGDAIIKSNTIQKGRK